MIVKKSSMPPHFTLFDRVSCARRGLGALKLVNIPDILKHFIVTELQAYPELFKFYLMTLRACYSSIFVAPLKNEEFQLKSKYHKFQISLHQY